MQLPANESTEQGYTPTYYSGSPNPAKAVALTVKAGEEILSTEILLRPVRVFTIRGRVNNMVSRRSNTDVMIQLVPRNTGLTWDFDSGGGTNVENQDGAFEIHDVLPGSYTLLAHWFDEGKRYQARQLLDVGNADLDGVALTIAPGISVSGHIQWDGQPSLTDRGELSVYLRGTEFEHAYGSIARVAGDTFTVKDLPEGAYQLNVDGESRDCFVKSVRFGGTESLDDGFTVRRGVDAALEVTISSRGARIQGAVVDADSLPAAGVWVVLVPDEQRRNQFRLYHARTTDQYGHFELRGIPPGDYKLFSWEEVENGAWQDPEFLKPFEAKGEEIKLQEGDQKTANLTAIKEKIPEQEKTLAHTLNQ